MRYLQDGIVVQHVRVLDLHEIEPAAPPPAASAHTPLTADLLKMRPSIASVFRGERASADSRRVGLHDTDDLSESRRIETQASHNTSQPGIRRSDEWV